MARDDRDPPKRKQVILRDDERDVLRHRTPPAGIARQIAKPVSADDSSGVPDHEQDPFEARTPAIYDPLARLEYRQYRSSLQLYYVRERVDVIEASAAKLDARLEALDEKIDHLVKIELEDRLKDRDVERTIKVRQPLYRLKIILAIVTAIGGALAAYVAGLRL